MSDEKDISLNALMDKLEKVYEKAELRDLTENEQRIVYVFNRYMRLDEVFAGFISQAIMFYFACKKRQDLESLMNFLDIMEGYLSSSVSGNSPQVRAVHIDARDLENLINKLIGE